jgi:hypothetical protein
MCVRCDDLAWDLETKLCSRYKRDGSFLTERLTTSRFAGHPDESDTRGAVPSQDPGESRAGVASALT